MNASLPIIIIPALILAGVLGFLILRFFQKRLHIFTKGTITFMVVALLATTAASTFDLLHGIKLTGHRRHGHRPRNGAFAPRPSIG